MIIFTINLCLFFMFSMILVAQSSVTVNVKAHISSYSNLSAEFNEAKPNLLSFSQTNLQDVSTHDLVDSGNNPVTQTLITGKINNNSPDGFNIFIETNNYYSGKNYLLTDQDSSSDYNNRLAYNLNCSVNTSNADSIYNNSYQTYSQTAQSSICIKGVSTNLTRATAATSELPFQINITLDTSSPNKIPTLLADKNYTDTITITQVDL
jgi:hypothetical protein